MEKDFRVFRFLCVPGVHQPWEAISEFSLPKSQNRLWDTGENMVSTGRQGRLQPHLPPTWGQGTYTIEFLGGRFRCQASLGARLAQLVDHETLRCQAPWHLSAPRTSHSEEWELTAIYPRPVTHPGVTCPHWGVRTVSATHSLCQVLGELGQLMGPRSAGTGPFPRYWVLPLAFTCHYSGKLRHLPVNWDTDVLDLSQNLSSCTYSLLF